MSDEQLHQEDVKASQNASSRQPGPNETPQGDEVVTLVNQSDPYQEEDDDDE